MDQAATAPPAATSATRLLVIVALLAAVGCAVYFVAMQQLEPKGDSPVFLTIGLAHPITNRLNDPYVDVDGDLIADAPADPAQQIDPDTLTFAFIAERKSPGQERYESIFAGLLEHIAQRTGKPVRFVHFDTSKTQLQAIRDGQLHIAVMNTGAVPLAVDACGFVPVAAPGSASGLAAYTMQIIVPASSPLQSVGDLKNRTLALTAPNSNSGYKAPLVLLMYDMNLRVGNDFQIATTRSHDNSIRAIANAEYDAAAVASDMIARAADRGEVDPSRLRVIYESEKFPVACYGYVYNLKPELAAQVREAMLDYPWAGTPLAQEYQSTGQDRLVPISYKDDWALIRRIDNALGVEHTLE